MFLFVSKPDFSCNPYSLWKYIEENTEHETAWLVSEKRHLEILRQRGIRCELYDTLRGNELAAEAKYIVSNVYVFDAIPKKEGQIFVNLWHGSGIKAHDFYDVNLPTQQMNRVLEFSNKTDMMCVHSLDDRFRLSAMLHYDLRKSLVTGQARLDCVKTSRGKEKLEMVLGKEILKYEHLIFFVPSFRANSSSHSGKFYSENVFRLDNFENTKLHKFLEKHNAALVYKLHPIEQTALKGVEFAMSSHCYELTDEMLFQADVRYDELLNAFDVMISDYSSIAFDFLLLDRPIVYLVSDYDEYKTSKGFVFHNIDYYMPGEKVYDFSGLLTALENGLYEPSKYSKARQNVLNQRFDFEDGQSAKRCYEVIINYEAPQKQQMKAVMKRVLPSSAELLAKYIPENILIADSTSEGNVVESERPVLYITEEIPDEYRSISRRASTDIADLSYYYKIKDLQNVHLGLVAGGVDNEHFAICSESNDNKRITIGFAGTVDCRIYFAMVQYICEAFPDCDVVFAGDIFGEYPAWLDGYENLYYIGQISYDKLPEVIQSFDVAILPFYGEYKQRIPNELFQYLACGKVVVTSDMPNLPTCKAIYRSKSVAEAVANVKRALEERQNPEVIRSAKMVAQESDWRVVAEKIMKEI